MGDGQITSAPVFLQPLPSHDTLNCLLLLARISERLTATERGCWVWGGSKNRDGYGNVSGGRGRVERIHRVVYRLCVSEIPAGVEVCHECDNPPCCNPAHLFLGTHMDNMRDAVGKGRIKSRDSRGEKNPSAKLDEESVQYIRRRAAEMTGVRITPISKILSAETGISEENVRRVIRRRIWGHIQ